MPKAKYLFGATVIGKKIYICGGIVQNGSCKKLEVFDCESNTWNELASMPDERNDIGMTTLNGNIYVTGGSDNSNEICYSSVLKYSPETNTWTELKSMYKKREGHELVTLNGEIYAIGGMNTKTVERYNSSKNEWNFVAPTTNEHYRFGATSYQNKIYVLSHNGFEVFDPNSNRWQSLPKQNIGYGTQLISINDELWIVGGENKKFGGASKKIFQFKTTNNKRKTLPDMNVPRLWHRAVVVNL